MASTRSRPRGREQARPISGGPAAEHATKIFGIAIASVVVIVAFLALTSTGHVIDAATQHFMLFYAGVFALIALCASVALGLIATDRMILQPGHRVFVQSAHRAASFGAVAFLIIHIVTEILAQRVHVLDAVRAVPVAVPHLLHRPRHHRLRSRVASCYNGDSAKAVHCARLSLALAGDPLHGLRSLRVRRLAWPARRAVPGKPYVDWSYGFVVALVALGLAVRILANSLHPKETLSAPPVAGIGEFRFRPDARGRYVRAARHRARRHVGVSPRAIGAAGDPRCSGPTGGPRARWRDRRQRTRRCRAARAVRGRRRSPAVLRTGIRGAAQVPGSAQGSSTGPMPRANGRALPRANSGPLPRANTVRYRARTRVRCRARTAGRCRARTPVRYRARHGPTAARATAARCRGRGPARCRECREGRCQDVGRPQGRERLPGHAPSAWHPAIGGTGPMPRVTSGPMPRATAVPCRARRRRPMPRGQSGPMPRAKAGPCHGPRPVPCRGPRPGPCRGPQTGPMPRAQSGPMPRAASGPMPSAGGQVPWRGAPRPPESAMATAGWSARMAQDAHRGGGQPAGRNARGQGRPAAPGWAEAPGWDGSSAADAGRADTPGGRPGWANTTGWDGGLGWGGAAGAGGPEYGQLDYGQLEYGSRSTASRRGKAGWPGQNPGFRYREPGPGMPGYRGPGDRFRGGDDWR